MSRKRPYEEIDKEVARLGWAILAGLDATPRSFNEIRRLTDAAYRDAQYREVGIREELARHAP